MRTSNRWYQGVSHAERKYKDAERPNMSDDEVEAHPDVVEIRKARSIMAQLDKIRVNRHVGQPFVSFFCFPYLT